MTIHFKCKLKTPTKSHYKKNEQTIDVFKKLPDWLHSNRINLDKDKHESVNLYYQDESRFGLMTLIGKCLTIKGIKPVVRYQLAFKNTYLYVSFSPMNGDSFVYEI